MFKQKTLEIITITLINKLIYIYWHLQSLILNVGLLQQLLNFVIVLSSQIMINSILLVLLLSLSSCLAISQDKELKATYTIFNCKYPQSNLPANSVLYLRGDSCNLTWTKGVPLKKISEDTWSTSMLCPTDIDISVKLLVNDTKWMMGANHVFKILSSDKSPNTTIYPSFNPSINKIIDTAAVSSAILKNQRKLSIYYPPSYNDNHYKKYQLLLMHDGQNLFDPSKAAFGVAWMCQNTTNTLIGEGAIRQVIIVGIWNTNDRINEYTYSYDASEKMGGKGDLYLDFIEKQLLPKLKAQYLNNRLLEDKGVYIGGSSLGGLISCYASYTRPTIYKKAICMSSSFWWNSEDFKNKIIGSKSYDASTTLYLDSGDSGPSQDNKASTDNAKASLIAKGYVEKKNLFYYLDKGGQHSQSYWGKRFHIPMQYLFGM